MPEMFSEIVKYRGLLAMLAWRDIRVRYKQSLLGVAWAFIMPLMQVAVFFVVFVMGPMKSAVAGDKTNHMPYLLFVLSGVILWTLFNATLASTTECLTRNSRLVTKIYFPREVFPLATVAGAMVDFSISQGIFVPIYVWYACTDPNVHAGWMLLLLPMVLLVEVVFLAGLALLVSMANLFYRDVKYIMTFALQTWFFATNVAYPIDFHESHPQLQPLTLLNPMISILNAWRDCLMGQGFHSGTLLGLAVSAIVALIVFLGGWWIFHKAEFRFAEYV